MLLVASTYHLPLDPQERALGKPYPPLGPLVAAAIGQRSGLPTALYDPMFCSDPVTFAEALRGHRPRKVALIADPHAVPQKQCTTTMRAAALAMLRLAKVYGAEVLVAGPDMSDHPELYTEADVVVVGEHEAVLQDWLNGRPLRGIQPRRPLIRDLDQLPEPAWEQVDLRAYADRWRARHGLWELPYSTARGCPYRCNWCAKPTWGRSYQVRSPQSVAVALHQLQQRYSPDRFWFTDDIFAIKPAWLREFRSSLPQPLRFRCLTRADLVKDPAYVADLAAAGCEEVWLGAESGSNRVLEAMDKDGSVEEIRRASQLLRDHGIRRGFFLQLGYPGEKPEDVEATLQMVRELRPEEIGISVSYPLPGTVFYERMKDRMQDGNWQKSMENRLLYAAEQPQEYYDRVREVLRAEHAILSFRPEFSKRGLRRAAALGWHAGRWAWKRHKMMQVSAAKGDTGS